MDYDFLLASDGTGDAALMTVAAARSIGATIIEVDTVSKVPVNFIATYGDLLPSGFLDPATKVDFKGHIDAGNLVIDSFEPGSVDAGNTEGQVVIIKPNTSWANDMVGLAKVAHNNDGTLKDDAVSTTEKLADFIVIGKKLSPGNKEYRQNSGGGTVDITSGTFVDWVTFGTPLDVPAWATKIRVSLAFNFLIVSSTTDGEVRLVVGTDNGRAVRTTYNSPPIGQVMFPTIYDEIPLTATGSQTIKVQARRVAGAGAYRKTATSDFAVFVEYLP